MRAATAGELTPDLSVAERAAVAFLLSDDAQLDEHTATVWAELVASDVRAEEQVGFVRAWMAELRDALRRDSRCDTT